MTPPSVREIARAYLARGWAVIPVPYQSKHPGFDDWQHARITADELAARFPSDRLNVSVLPGAPSGGLADVDLDVALAVALADRFLPRTRAVFGRASRPRSHRLYQLSGAATSKTWKDPTVSARDERAMLLELRCSGHTLFPGSTHPSGEAITWDEAGNPATVDAAELRGSLGRLAAATLLARHWPGEGARHDAALALGGGLLRAGWTIATVEQFLEAVVVGAGDEEVADRLRTVDDSAAALTAGGPVTGWPTLAESIDPRVVAAVQKWLALPKAATSSAGSSSDSEPPTDPAPPPDGSQASQLVSLAVAQQVELFHDPTGEPYASFPINGHLETWPLRSKTVRIALSRLFYLAKGKAPGSQALQDALAVLEGEARFAGPERLVAVRLADHDGNLYLDCGDPDWRVIAIAPGSWALIAAAAAPVRFRRPRGMQSLPEPVRGGSLVGLRELLNVSDDDDFLLLVGWLLGALFPRGPQAVLQLLGEQGTAKSSAARLLRSLVDPNAVPLRAEPRNEGDLLIAAVNGLTVALDNLSEIPRWLSDALCRLATGGGLSKRELYSDAEEVLLDARRPVLLTAIAEVAVASDLLDRTLTVTLPPIPAEGRRTEAEVNALAAIVRPQAFGALLDAAAAALASLPTFRLERRPRLADFATWVEAAAPTLGWEAGAFLDALEANRRGADAVALEALPLGAVLLRFMAERDQWDGTATELLAALDAAAGEEARKDKEWPKRANRLSNQLRRLAPNLRRVGIGVGYDRTPGGGARTVSLTKNHEAWDRHHRHDRHNLDETTASHDDRPSSQNRHSPPSPSSQDRHTGAGPSSPDRLKPAQSCAPDGSRDGRDDGDDPERDCSNPDPGADWVVWEEPL